MPETPDTTVFTSTRALSVRTRPPQTISFGRLTRLRDQKQNKKTASHSLPRRSPLLFPPVPAADEAAHYEALHRKYAPRLVAVYMKLGGFYYKSGQKMAANMGGFVPKYYQDICQPFLNDIPVRHFPAQFPPF